MKRQTIWVVCCAVVTVTILLKDSSVPAVALIGFYTVIGVPMFAHWLFEPRSDQDYIHLCAALYQACGAYDMPERVLDALSAAANAQPFIHLVDGILPCMPDQPQNTE